jgi:K+-sensing histidine kinase KdpD
VAGIKEPGSDSALRDEVTALVVHDLKNPLASIAVNASYLKDCCTTIEEAREVAGELETAAESMGRMISNLLDIARREEGSLLPQLVEIEIGGFLRGIQAEMQRRARESSRTIQLTTDLPTKTMRADPDLLRRVLENLVDNSLRYAPSGSAVQLEARSLAGDVELRVRDAGPGVPVEHRDKVFRKHVRAPGEAACNVRSSRGLGLVFCRLAVEAHGGRIWVEDDQPTGSVFCVRLPQS